ncbi:FAD-dependent oxidoreductase [Alteromonas abrolhosensis]|uniref:FAD-dependent oxidoreductase n=1 Tax=Alteromonas abrolhosensis TaxID=1892904 RepID=UPI003BAA4F3B
MPHSHTPIKRVVIVGGGIAGLSTAYALIEEAKAREQAALMQAKARVTLAQAEGEAKIVQAKAEGLADIERAKAAAEANRIIGESLKGNEEYLRYVWIKGLQDGNGERIYIPTEAGLPILEAGKAGK